MEIWQARPVTRHQGALGEGPVWDSVRQLLWWVDITGCAIHTFSPADGRETCLATGKTVGSLVLRENGGLVAGLADGFYQIQDDEISLCCPIDRTDNLERLNDGKCDPSGRYWAGTQSGAMPYSGKLYRFSGSNAAVVLEHIGCSNGLAWNAAKDRMYYIDTSDKTLDVLDYDDQTGSVANRRTLVDFTVQDPPAGWPDGMAIDREGMLWIAEWNGARVGRWDPDTGRKLGEVRLPVSRPTCCTFGGQTLTTLYISTAFPPDPASEPDAGRVFAAEVGIQGLLPNRFK